LLEEKVGKMEEQIGDLVAMRKHLRTVLAEWDERLTHTSHGKPARLLETLVVPGYGSKPRKLKGKAISQVKKEFT